MIYWGENIFKEVKILSGRKIPAISVIIPMYNAEKYIGECLESILNQTFQDFEVIVVDDCSTDNSCKIVEDYEKKFNVGEHGTLRLVRLETNSGAPGVPNNTGLALSRGEYISFIEADDAITNTAYEELYPIAKKFDADVVQCEGFYEIAETSKIDKNNLKPTHYKKTTLVTEPTLITDDLKERVTALVRGDFFLNVWTKLIRRDFIVQNNLKMLSINHHDTSYSCLLVCAAKRYVLAPNVINFYRVVENSMSHKKENVEKTVKKYCKTFLSRSIT